MIKDLYLILGLSRDAKLSDIKKAYRKLAMERHPDHGGSEDAMEDLNVAYHVLSDSNRRRIYDETGYYEERHVQSVEEEALALISVTLQYTAETFGDWLPYVDIVGEIKKQIDRKVKNCIGDKSHAAAAYDLMLECAKGFKPEENVETNLIKELMEKLAEGPQDTVTKAERYLKVTEKALAILEKYHYTPKEMTPEQAKALDRFLHPKPKFGMFGMGEEDLENPFGSMFDAFGPEPDMGGEAGKKQPKKK